MRLWIKVSEEETPGGAAGCRAQWCLPTWTGDTILSKML